MPDVRFQGRLLDVRPDKLDLRDRPFRPQLNSLPTAYPTEEVIEWYLPLYEEAGLVLDQGSEGACTGFGLACVINFLYWARDWRAPILDGRWDEMEYWPEPPPIERVSTRMLYHLARFYDEWPGEDYSGSSCRGAMRGWHRHGVCSQEMWPYADEAGDPEFVRPREGWQRDAARRRVGAYYRVAAPAFSNPDLPAEQNRLASVDDLQAAVFEVGAVYVSATVHQGWMEVPIKAQTLPTIDCRKESVGGHAFAIVGYNREGFIIQNSWGPKWGYHGFAVLTYRDWVNHGYDAWVAALGAPVEPYSPSNFVFDSSIQFGATTGWRAPGMVPDYVYRNPQVEPWPEVASDDPLENPHRYAIVVGNNGVPIKRLLEARDGADAIKIVVSENFRHWHAILQPNRPRICVFLHGGLTSEENGLQRTRHMGPYFTENGIYPIFVNWKTGILETLWGLAEDAITWPTPDRRPSEGVLDWIEQQISEAKDRALEVAAESAVKPFWTQMKQNARLAAEPPGGDFDRPVQNAVAAMLQQIVALRDGSADHGALPAFQDLELHVIGHSAGSIMLGEMLPLLESIELPVATCTLWAPACTIAFALEKYVPAMESGILGMSPDRFAIEILSDDREQADSAGPYGKSILYLVSRALEDFHKTPLLGMEREWDSEVDPKRWGPSGDAILKEWRLFATRKRIKPVTIVSRDTIEVILDERTWPSTHGNFDNDVHGLQRALQRILGGTPRFPVENLVSF